MPRNKDRHPLWDSLIDLSPILLLLVIFLFLFRTAWQEYVVILIYLVLFIILDFGFPLITQRGKKGYWEKLKAEQENESKSETLYSLIGRKLGRTSLIIIPTLMFALLISYSAGKAQALEQDEFLIANTFPETAVLRIYDNKMILAPFNRETKEVQKSFRVQEITKDPKLILKLEKIGPLYIKK